MARPGPFRRIIASRLEPGMIMDALFSEWDAARGRPTAEVTAWADHELDRAFAEQAAATKDADTSGAA
ncbi:MAG: hypothetical protein ACXWYP_02275 [Pseudonocardia sp.]